MADLKVSDSEYQVLAETLSAFSGVLDTKLNIYSNQMQVLIDEGITSGDASENLRLFIIQYGIMKEKAQAVYTDLVAELQSFVPSIDEADEMLYI